MIRCRLLVSATGLACALSASHAHAQLRVLLADRTAEKLWTLTDRNNDGTIDASEIAVFYDASNLSGLQRPINPNMIGVTRSGDVYMGDQDSSVRHWLLLRDRDHNGDALAEGEAIVAANATNAGGFSFAFPVGFAEGPDGRIFLVNAGNGFGPDQIFACRDLNADGDFLDEGEITGLVTINGFGANGPLSPQELAFGTDGAMYLRNSTTNNHGIFRLRDNDSSGLIDAADEYTLFWGAGNAPGITPSAGFAVEPDPTRARAFYVLQTATGSLDQLIRCQDLNTDNDALDDGESAIVFSTPEAGFTGIDVLALPAADGRVLLSENSGPRIISLRDIDGDGLFSSPGERSDFLPAGLGVLAARAMVILYCPADFNQDLRTDPDDLADFIACYFAPGSEPCDRADYDRSGTVDPDDLSDFIAAYFQPC